MRQPRKCEVCGHEWKSKFDYSWILLCPKCRISGYHIPATKEGKVNALAPAADSTKLREGRKGE